MDPVLLNCLIVSCLGVLQNTLFWTDKTVCWRLEVLLYPCEHLVETVEIFIKDKLMSHFIYSVNVG